MRSDGTTRGDDRRRQSRAGCGGVEGEFQPSLDLTQRLGANVLASVTINTDFAETEVDTRRTNLTRFPLFFPEKRTFFLEGSDIFTFGLGLGEDVIPFFSRRIGLVGGCRSANHRRRQGEWPRRRHQLRRAGRRHERQARSRRDECADGRPRA